MRHVVLGAAAGVCVFAAAACSVPASDGPAGVVVSDAASVEATLTPPTVPGPTEPVLVFYRSCAEAEDAGATPLRRGEPGYRKALDRDRDGIACEVTP